MKPLIAVDASPAVRAAVTGTERMTRELVTRLPAAAPELDFVFLAPQPAPDLAADLLVLPARRAFTQARVPLELLRHRPALFLALGHVTPRLSPAPAVKVVHDLAFERLPEAYPWRARTYLRWTERYAARHCRRLITPSRATKADLVEMYGVDPARVDVAPLGIEAPAPPRPAPGRLRELGLDRPFALHVGRVETRKNPIAAARAAAAAGLRLACAGAIHDTALADRLRAIPEVRLLGSVPAADLDLLYRSATALVFPSLYEGFGLPVLEAMARDLPVILPRTSSLPEVAGAAGLYVDGPDDVAGMAAWLRRLEDDPALCRRTVAAGRRQVAGFSWERCAAAVAQSLRAALS